MWCAPPIAAVLCCLPGRPAPALLPLRRRAHASDPSSCSPPPSCSPAPCSPLLQIARAAAAAGVSPQEHCDAIAQKYVELWDALDIRYDAFVRTTAEQHERVVSEFLERVWANGDIYKSAYEGKYCVDCEEYKDEKQMTEEGDCLIHRRPCEDRREENYFFRLSAYQSQLEALLEDETFCNPASRRNEVATLLREGARDFSISRSAVEWGIPLERDPEQTVYVWFDALLGYVSALLGDRPISEAEAAGWPADYHIVGKDILRFHAVYWPAMLMSAGLPVPKGVYGHGFLTKDGLKMGKSMGNTLEPMELVDKYGADAVRYYFCKACAFGKDGDFSEAQFLSAVNTDLANDLGNLLNRSKGLLKKRCGNTLPRDAAELRAEGHAQAAAVDAAVEAAAAAYDRLDFTAAGEAAMEIVREGNRLFDAAAPWATLKSEDEAEVAAGAEALLVAMETVRAAAVMLAPIVPTVAKSVYQQLGYTDEEWEAVTWEDARWGGIVASRDIPKAKAVFQRMEAVEAEVAGAAA